MANSDKPKNNKVNQESGSNKNKKKKLPRRDFLNISFLLF